MSLDTGREIASRALKATHPRMSLAATHREAIRSGISKKVVDEVIAQAQDIVDAELAGRSSRERASTWITPSRAAGLLGTTVAWVQEKLETPEGRRLLGFPWYDGRRWRIPLPACHPDSRAAFLAALPADEPLANLVLLPEDDRSQ